MGLDDRGDIVGVADDGAKPWGVRFTDPGIVKLDDEITNLGRWHVTQATDVNARGDIVAIAVGPRGQARTVLLRLDGVGAPRPSRRPDRKDGAGIVPR